VAKKDFASYLGLLFLILATGPALARAAEGEPPSSKFLTGKIVFDLQLVPTTAKEALVQL